MQFEGYEYYEIAAIVGYGTLFTLWERWRPAHDIRRRADWRRDLLALFVLAIGIYLARTGMKAAIDASGVASWLAGQPWRRWPKLAQLFTAGLLVDFSLYWIHRLMHTRWFWNAHKWHHSSEHLYWLSGLRTSVVHVALFALPQVLVAFYVFPFTLADIGMASASGVFTQLFIHANIRLPLGPLEYIIVTPQNHRRHHALVEGIAHGNYGTGYAFWDRLFGTYVDYRSLPKNYPLGLAERGDPVRMSIGV